MSKVVDNLKQLLFVYLDCPSLEELNKLPDTEYISLYINRLNRRTYDLAYQLLDERYPDKIEANKRSKMLDGYAIAFADFVSEFDQKMDELAADRINRMTYIKWTLNKLYIGPSRYDQQKALLDFLNSKNFKAFKSQIDSDLWEQLDEIGCAIFISTGEGMAISKLLENRLRIEGEPPIEGSYLEKEQYEQAQRERDWASQQAQPDSSNVNQEKQASSGLNEDITEKPRRPFDGMSSEEATKWFMRLATNNNKNGSPFLTPEDVSQFTERAFAGRPFTEKLTLNVANGDKGNVVGLFHKFFIYCTTDQPKTGKIDKEATTRKYIKLLTDNFDNWTFDQVKDNFKRGGNW